jgi:hypothetical protein
MVGYSARCLEAVEVAAEKVEIRNQKRALFILLSPF